MTMSFWGDLARIGLSVAGTALAPGIGTALGGALGNFIGGTIEGSDTQSKNTTQQSGVGTLGTNILSAGLGALGNSFLPGIGMALGSSLGGALGQTIFGGPQPPIRGGQPINLGNVQTPNKIFDFSKEKNIANSTGFLFNGQMDNPMSRSLYTMASPTLFS